MKNLSEIQQVATVGGCLVRVTNCPVNGIRIGLTVQGCTISLEELRAVLAFAEESAKKLQ